MPFYFILFLLPWFSAGCSLTVRGSSSRRSSEGLMFTAHDTSDILYIAFNIFERPFLHRKKDISAAVSFLCWNQTLSKVCRKHSFQHDETRTRFFAFLLDLAAILWAFEIMERRLAGGAVSVQGKNGAPQNHHGDDTQGDCWTFYLKCVRRDERR